MPLPPDDADSRIAHEPDDATDGLTRDFQTLVEKRFPNGIGASETREIVVSLSVVSADLLARDSREALLGFCDLVAERWAQRRLARLKRLSELTEAELGDVLSVLKHEASTQSAAP